MGIHFIVTADLSTQHQLDKSLSLAQKAIARISLSMKVVVISLRSNFRWIFSLCLDECPAFPISISFAKRMASCKVVICKINQHKLHMISDESHYVKRLNIILG